MRCLLTSDDDVGEDAKKRISDRNIELGAQENVTDESHNED